MKTNSISPNGIVYVLGTGLIVAQALEMIRLVTLINKTSAHAENLANATITAGCYPMFMVLAAMFVLSQIAENKG